MDFWRIKDMKSFVKMVLQIVRRIDYITIYTLCRVFYSVDRKKVLFLSDSRNDLSGNFAFLYDEIKEEYDIKSFLQHTDKGSKWNFCKELAKAKYIFVDDFYPLIYPIPLRKETELIQVWHAVGAFKTVGFARKQNKDRFSMTHRNYTGAIVSSEAIRKDYAKAFRMELGQVYSTGVPRTDIFWNQDYVDKKKQELYERYPILKDKKVILFAPTFRGNNVNQAYYDWSKIDFKAFQNKFSEEYVCIVKMHPFVKNKCEQILDPSFYLDLTGEREINDLLLVTDTLITDYSSVIFEAALLDIQVIFFAYDLEEYIAERDFFYPYESYTYGPVVKSQEELELAILHEKDCSEKKKKFVTYFMASCDGASTKRVVETFLKR